MKLNFSLGVPIEDGHAVMQALARFGIATECSFGRRPPESVPGRIALQPRLAQEVSG